MTEDILIPTERLGRSELERFKNQPFENLIKFAADIAENKIALGGEMNADDEAELIQTGSRQSDVWGGNLWPWVSPMKIECISLINIRPSQDNAGMDIRSEEIRAAVRRVVAAWVDLS